MIIDNHVHVFPDQAGPAGHPDAQTYRKGVQPAVRSIWGRWVTSHSDPKYIPDPGEDVGFTIGPYGRWHWQKHGEACWTRQTNEAMTVYEHSPEQMLEHMDFVGVDMGVIQTGYMAPEYGQEVYFLDCIKRWPDRFIGLTTIDYDLSKGDEHLQSEIRRLTRAVEEQGYKGLESHVARDQPVDDPRCDPLWNEIARLGIPVFLNTGLGNSREEHLAKIKGIENVCRRYPEMNALNAMMGAMVFHPDNPDYVDNPREFFPLFALGNFYLEVGYVNSFENESIWGRESEYPYPRHEQLIKTIYENFGAGVMVWGSDMPFAMRTCTYRQNLDTIRWHTNFMTDADRALVMGDNLARIYHVGDA